MRKEKPSPPGFADRFLSWFCKAELLPEIQGDLFELYQRWVQEYGARKAKWLYILNVITFFRPFTVRRRSIHFQNPISMLINYWLIASRTLQRHKTTSFINICGLTIGMSVCLLMLMVIKDLFSYDSFHPYPDRTYRITTIVNTTNGVVHQARTPLVMGSTLKENYPSIENVVRIYPADAIYHANVKHQDKELPAGGVFADASFFDVFGFNLTSGNPDNALTEPFTVVLTQETATKFFGSEDALGETLTIGALGDFKVTGIIAEPPQKTHLNYELFASMATVPILEKTEKLEESLEAWKAYSASYTYILLKPDAQVEVLAQVFPSIARRAMQTFEFNAHGTATGYSFDVQPLEDIMPTKLFYETHAGMSATGVMMFSSIALAILLIAGFNYTNLTVARSLGRAKEIGIRNVTGATGSQIFSQFISESVLLSLLALLVAFLFAKLLLLNAGFAQLVSGITLDIELLLWFLIFSICVGLLAGALPAWMFSKITSLQALRSLTGIKLMKGMALRKIFIVLQFSLSLVFVIVLLVAYRQSHYVATADNGYNRENLIAVDLQGVNYELATSKMAAHTNVEKVTATSGNFGLSFGANCKVQKQQGDAPLNVYYYAVDEQFIPTMELELLSGQNFPEYTSAVNESYVILNEKAIQALDLGTPAEAVGKTLWLNDSLSVEVAGVVKDFHFLSLKHAIYPMALRYKPDEFKVLNLKVEDPYAASFSAYLQEEWKELNPLHPLESYVYEDRFYESWIHKQDMAFMGSFAFMAIFIACLGLLGVVMYSMETRIKEIGIRKVIGASVVSLTLLLSKDFLKLLLIAGAVALPMGYWIGYLFLQEYAYRINIGFGLLSLGFTIMLLLGLVIISSHTIRAALANPVDSLRNE